MSDLGDLTLVEAAAAVRDGELSPVELTEHHLARIEETEPVLHAYACVDADGARSQARAAEQAVQRGERLGPLHGVPVGVKDLIDTAGRRTTYGSPRFADHVPLHDATAVSRLRAAGAVLLGKHRTHELAWGGRTDSAFYGPTHNPYRHGHIPGGSSGGSAASVAAGSSLGSLGTDTAGSVRIPAALSGCVGYKPTRGLVSLHGVMPLAPSLDHLGALGRTVADAAALVAAVAGHDPADPRTLADQVPALSGEPADPSNRMRVGWLGGWFTAVLDDRVRTEYESVRARLEKTGVETVDVEVPDEPAMTEAVLTRILAEAGAIHRRTFESDPGGFGADIAELMRLPAPTPARLAHTEAVISRFSAVLHTALESCDVLVAPTEPTLAPEIGATTVEVGGKVLPVELVLTRLTSPFDATGLPAVSVPVALVDGLPVAVQVVGRRLDDATALGVARLVEQLVPRIPRPQVEGGGRQ